MRVKTVVSFWSKFVGVQAVQYPFHLLIYLCRYALIKHSIGCLGHVVWQSCQQSIQQVDCSGCDDRIISPLDVVHCEQPFDALIVTITCDLELTVFVVAFFC